ncbi:HAD-IIB family hydrolase [Geomicrobium sediminis]|uniref:HAD superfamily hydrolase (TIGR01484 family) n=1 Tax=Geomicrobium sediminis TaxID=1347788 RepID=A0ABS2PBM7_9BACL|nr:HAD-IIB family hydrolase [Geomicrobium sediminis]MBM7632714.1 HAD superfamily hydrolase (TIGR01484 family) [Geomicrobium sediminis]
MQFIFDLDGTIVFNGKKMSTLIADELVALKEYGHDVTFASARGIRDMLPVIDERLHDVRLIGANGAVVWENQKLRRYVDIDHETFRTVTAILKDIDATYLIDGHWDYSIVGDEEHPFLPMINVLQNAKDVSVDELQFISKLLVLECGDPTPLLDQIPTLNITRHRYRDEARFDLTGENVNKRAGFQSVCAEDYIMFGNDLNDLPLFQKAVHSVMIGDFAPLFPYAKEQIQLNARTEATIVETIRSLKEKHTI